MTLAALITAIVGLISAAIYAYIAVTKNKASAAAAVAAQQKADLDDIAKANDARLRQRVADAHGVPDDADPNRRD
jgi:hypothetical protein